MHDSIMLTFRLTYLFVFRYPEVVSRQNLYWDARYIQIDKAYCFSKIKIKSSPETNTVKKSSVNTSPSKKHKLSKNSLLEDIVVKKLRTM